GKASPCRPQTPRGVAGARAQKGPPADVGGRRAGVGPCAAAGAPADNHEAVAHDAVQSATRNVMLVPSVRMLRRRTPGAERAGAARTPESDDFVDPAVGVGAGAVLDADELLAQPHRHLAGL